MLAPIDRQTSACDKIDASPYLGLRSHESLSVRLKVKTNGLADDSDNNKNSNRNNYSEIRHSALFLHGLDHGFLRYELN